MNVIAESVPYMDKEILFHIIQMDGQCFAWVGDQSCAFEDLHISFPGRPGGPVGTMPPLSTLMGADDSFGASMCQKLTAALKYPIYLSFNIPSPAPELSLFVHKELKRILSKSLEEAKGA